MFNVPTLKLLNSIPGKRTLIKRYNLTYQQPALEAKRLLAEPELAAFEFFGIDVQTNLKFTMSCAVKGNTGLGCLDTG